MTEQMRVLIIADHFAPAFRAGGPVRSLSAIVELPLDVEFAVLTRNRDLGTTGPLDGVQEGVWIRRGSAEVLYVDTRSIRSWLRAVNLLRQRRYVVWYLNSLFSPVATLLPLAVARLGFAKPKRIVVAPRGELSPGALSLSRRKKQLLLLALRLTRTANRIFWHATSTTEQVDIRSALGAGVGRIHLAPQMAILPDGLVSGFRDDRTCSSATRAVFLSRITPKKNLLSAIEALEHTVHPVHLKIFGPIEDHEYWNRCAAAIERVAPRHTVLYLGEASPPTVTSILRGADVFLLPTLGENFGHVIFEALAAHCPVIIGRETPWTERVHGRCGWALPPSDVIALAAALDQFHEFDADMRARYRAASREAAVRWVLETADESHWSMMFRGDDAQDEDLTGSRT